MRAEARSRLFHTELSFELSGSAEISERRIEKDQDHGYESINLLSATDIKDNMNWGLVYSVDPDFSEQIGCWTCVNFYHIKDEETGRVFHTHINAQLHRSDLVKLREFCTYLLSLEELS
jgi:hypothetical protein